MPAAAGGEILQEDTSSATATTKTTPTTTAAAARPTMEKQDRKRLKKLRKRAFAVLPEGERSGLLTRLEWLEFQKFAAMLGATTDDDVATTSKNNSAAAAAAAGADNIPDNNSTSSVGPLIVRRKRKEANKVEGSHHRDLVAWFMDRMRYPDDDPQTKKKRARNQNDDDDDPLQNPKIPSWASIHNPSTIGNLVVLEVQVSSSKNTIQELSSIIGKCQSIVDAAVSQSKGRTSLHSPTKWFQGNVPKAMSDSLFYFVNTSQSKRPKVEQESGGGPSIDQLVTDMEEMILPLDQWGKEGYPLAINPGNTVDHHQAPSIVASSWSLQEYDSIPVTEAKEFVAKFGFRIQNQKEGDQQLYISTQAYGADGDDSSEIRVFGMDCEMVMTSLGSELARITLVQLKSFENDKQETTTVLDALVKPENPIKDYLTRHSGITPELLKPVSTRLPQIQVALWKFLRPTDILVGHSLENDFLAAHYIHPRVIDTSLVFQHRNKRTKFSLRHMSASLLKKTIQQGSHCSKEDAEATLELAIRRAWLKDGFALPNMDERRSILEKWNAANEMKMVCIGPTAWLQTHVTNQANGVHALGCDSISDCKKAILAWSKGPRKSHLSWCNLNIVDNSSDDDFGAFERLLVRK